MTWETIIENALQGISNFVNSLISIIFGSLNPAALEGIIALAALGVVIRLIDNAPKIPGKIVERLKKEEEYEYVMIRRKK